LNNKKSIHNSLMNEIISVIFFLIISGCFLSAQDFSSDSTNKFKKDTVYYSLKFRAGDTLLYNVNAQDSIIIDFGVPLKKNRQEKIRIVCDSVNVFNHFFLSQTMIYSESDERYGAEEVKSRTSNPWVNRKIWFEIDSLGTRYSYNVDDSAKATMAPGGAFQPHLFFAFQKQSATVNQTWIAQATVDLPENGVPVPLLRESLLCRAHQKIDTLGDTCSRFEFIKTAQGNIKLYTTDTIQVSSVVNGFGIYTISEKRNIPVHYFSTVEQKLTMTFPDGDVKPGIHFQNVYFTLESLKHAKLKTNSGKQLQKNKKKIR
jgi:hypothetical protein